MPWWWPFGRVADIDAATLADQLDSAQPPQVLDVRSALEWRGSRVPGARHLPIVGLRQRWPELALDPQRPVVLVCLSAHRSVPAVRLLQEAGFDARQLRGGMLAWWRAGLPVERGR